MCGDRVTPEASAIAGEPSVVTAGEPRPLQRASCEGLGSDRKPCGKQLAGRQIRFCSESCRWRLWDEAHPRQARLPLDPPPEPVQLLGPTPEQLRHAQKPQTIRVLRLLQAAGLRGVTTGEFLASYIGRFGARLGELKAVGHQILRVDESAHSSRYTLVGPPPVVLHGLDRESQ